jgi:hypothetical protein
MISAIVRSRPQFLAFLHGLGCAVSLVVFIALPTVVVHHSHMAFRMPEAQREAARHTIADESEPAAAPRLAQFVRHDPLKSAAAVCAPALTTGYPIAIAAPRLPRLFRRLKLPPPGSLDPFQHELV